MSFLDNLISSMPRPCPKCKEKKTPQTLAFGEGRIYPCLHYLEQEKLLRSLCKKVGGRSRNYYQLTRRGAKGLEAINTDWDRVSSGISFLRRGKDA